MKTKYQIHKEQLDVLKEVCIDAAYSDNVHKNSYVAPILRALYKRLTDDYNYELYKSLISHSITIYQRGSVVYGTYELGVSDSDVLVVIDNSCHSMVDDSPRHILEIKIANGGDYQFICEDDFTKMVEDNSIEALECIFSTINPDDKFLKMFKLDKWKLRESVSAICSNSWVKAKKKLTVEKDYDLRIAQKSLWHSMRIYMFAIQIAEHGSILNYQCANDLWYEIKNTENPTWDYYKEKYQEKFNNLRSELVKLCPKPDRFNYNI